MSELRSVIIVWEWEHALLYRHGQFVETLTPGRHVRWGFGWSVLKLDALPTFYSLPDQEVQTSDGAPVRVSGAYRVQITDPHKYKMSNLQPVLNLGTEAQIAVRDWASGLEFETALKDRDGLVAAMLARLQTVAEDHGMQVDWVGVRDLAPGPGLRAAYLDVLKAQLEAKSALERARSEAATMRSLANTARLIKEHPGLLELRLLQGNKSPRVTFFVGDNKGTSGE